MRILYIGFNRSYTNPTAELILRVLARVANLEYYGPGFSDRTSLAKGIFQWADEQQPYDFIAVDSYVLECESVMKRQKPFMGDFIRFEPADFFEYALSYQKFFLGFHGKKIFISNWDIYNISETNINKLFSSQTYILEGGVSTTNSKKWIESAYGKPFTSGNDNWFHFVRDYKDKIISFPHFISSSEFDFSPIYKRPYLFNVIGAPYDERKDAKQLMTKKQKQKDLKDLIKLKLRQYLISTMSNSYLTSLRANYFNEISKSKLCFCSGGPWLYPVRKYFEIPGRGAVAIGWTFTGFENLGFEDGKNFILAQDNNALSKYIDNYDEAQMQTIANNGRELIWQLHSEASRTVQLMESLNRIVQNTFKGSYWQAGKYLHFE